MKKIISALLAVTMLFALLSVGSVTAFAEDAQSDYLYVMTPPGRETDKNGSALIYPAIDQFLLKYNGTAEIVDVPTNTSSNGPLMGICQEAFIGNTTIKRVTLPSSVFFIDARAFAGCTALTSIQIPARTVEIATDAFDGCPSNLTIIAPAGSYAEQYAKAQGINFKNVDAGEIPATIKPPETKPTEKKLTTKTTAKTQKVTVKKVKKLTASIKGRKVTIKITKANKKYKTLIQYKKKGAKKYKKLALTNKTKVTKTLRKGKYQIRACSYLKQNGKVYKSGYRVRTIRIK